MENLWWIIEKCEAIAIYCTQMENLQWFVDITCIIFNESGQKLKNFSRFTKNKISYKIKIHTKFKTIYNNSQTDEKFHNTIISKKKKKYITKNWKKNYKLNEKQNLYHLYFSDINNSN